MNNSFALALRQSTSRQLMHLTYLTQVGADEVVKTSVPRHTRRRKKTVKVG